MIPTNEFLEAVARQALENIGEIDRVKLNELSEMADFFKKMAFDAVGTTPGVPYTNKNGRVSVQNGDPFLDPTLVYLGEDPQTAANRLLEDGKLFNERANKYGTPIIPERFHPIFPGFHNKKNEIYKLLNEKINEIKNQEKRRNQITGHFDSLREKLANNPIEDPNFTRTIEYENRPFNALIGLAERKAADFIRHKESARALNNYVYTGEDRNDIQPFLDNMFRKVNEREESRLKQNLKTTFQNIGEFKKDGIDPLDAIRYFKNIKGLDNESYKYLDQLEAQALEDYTPPEGTFTQGGTRDPSQEQPNANVGTYGNAQNARPQEQPQQQTVQQSAPQQQEGDRYLKVHKNYQAFKRSIESFLRNGYKGNPGGAENFRDNYISWLADNHGDEITPGNPEWESHIRTALSAAYDMANTKEFTKYKNAEEINWRNWPDVFAEIQKVNPILASAIAGDEQWKAAFETGKDPVILQTLYGALVDQDIASRKSELQYNNEVPPPVDTTHADNYADEINKRYKKHKAYESETETIQNKIKSKINNEGFLKNVNDLIQTRLKEPKLGDLEPEEAKYLSLKKQRMREEFEEETLRPLLAHSPAGGINGSGYLSALLDKAETKYKKYVDDYENEFLMKRREDRRAHNERISQVGKDLFDTSLKEDARFIDLGRAAEAIHLGNNQEALNILSKYQGAIEKNNHLKASMWQYNNERGREKNKAQLKGSEKRVDAALRAAGVYAPTPLRREVHQESIPESVPGGGMGKAVSSGANLVANLGLQMGNTRSKKEEELLEAQIDKVRAETAQAKWGHGNKQEKKAKGGKVHLAQGGIASPYPAYPSLNVPDSSPSAGESDIYLKKLELLKESRRNPLLSALQGFQLPPASKGTSFWDSVSSALNGASQAMSNQEKENTTLTMQALDLGAIYEKSKKEAKTAEFENSLKKADSIYKQENNRIQKENNEGSRELRGKELQETRRHNTAMEGAKKKDDQEKDDLAKQNTQASIDKKNAETAKRDEEIAEKRRKVAVERESLNRDLSNVEMQQKKIDEMIDIVRKGKAWTGPGLGLVPVSGVKLLNSMGLQNKESVHATGKLDFNIANETFDIIRNSVGGALRGNQYIERKAAETKPSRNMDDDTLIESLLELKSATQYTKNFIEGKRKIYAEEKPAKPAKSEQGSKNDNYSERFESFVGGS